jgi:hypothetical protein
MLGTPSAALRASDCISGSKPDESSGKQQEATTTLTQGAGIKRQLSDRNGPVFIGGQGRNRTTDTRIFSPGAKTDYVAEMITKTYATASNISARYWHLRA